MEEAAGENYTIETVSEEAEAPISHEESEQNNHNQIQPPNDNQLEFNVFVRVERLTNSESELNPNNADVIEIVDTNSEQELSVNEIAKETPRSSKKRKRTQSISPDKEAKEEDVDDGVTCSICLEHWDISGTHRLTSLKCGHLFGQSCIRRWLSECAPGMRCCPSCKTKAAIRDMRHLYAKKICAVDNTEENRLRELVDVAEKKTKDLTQLLSTTRYELVMAQSKISKLEADMQILRRLNTANIVPPEAQTPRISYKMFLEKNIEISKDPGSRVIIYGKSLNSLIVSQKSTQSLFPGYGVRFIDTETFKATNFLHMSVKSVRDLSLHSSEDLLVSATMEKSAKLFDIRDKSVVAVFTPSEKTIWACALDNEISNHLYLGSQHGSTYVHDVRFPANVVEEFKNERDSSPVINICTVQTSNFLPFGGLLICKLQSIWFYEKNSSQEIIPIKLNVEGPFMSMAYDSDKNTVLIAARPSSRHAQSRYIVGRLVKDQSTTFLDTIVIFYGSKETAVMTRCTQIPVRDNSLVAAYLQDVKLLSMWDLRESCRIQSLPVSELVYDMCPVLGRENTFLAALTATKCRIYKLTSTEGL